MLHLGTSAAVKDVSSQFTGEISLLFVSERPEAVGEAVTFHRGPVRQGTSLLPVLYKPELGFCPNPASVDPRHISVALCPDQHRPRATDGDTFHNRAGNS